MFAVLLCCVLMYVCSSMLLFLFKLMVYVLFQVLDLIHSSCFWIIAVLHLGSLCYRPRLFHVSIISPTAGEVQY